MKFQKQAKSEFGRTWAAPRGQAAALAAGSSGSGQAAPEAGRAFASFYGSLVQSTGARWVSGGTLTDGAVVDAPAAAAPAAAAREAAATAADAAPPLEAGHAGLGSATARAELQAEAEALQYAAPAGPAPRGQQAVQQGPADGQQQQQQQQQAGPVRYGISRTNVGFQLLKKAGWREGAGLGAQQQGRPEPVSAFQQRGNLGLGFAPKPRPKPADGTVPAPAAGAAGQAVAAAAQQRPKRALPEDPLDKEDTDTKVKRVGQVMQTEADEKAGKAIARYIHMAFSDATGEPTRDSNPLLRRNHKLSATNPLL